MNRWLKASSAFFLVLMQGLFLSWPAFSKDSPDTLSIGTELRTFLNGADVVVDPKLDVNGDIAIAQNSGTKPALFFSHYDSKANPPIYYPRYKTYLDSSGKSWGLAQYKGGGNWSDVLKTQDGLIGIGTSKPTKNLTVVSSGDNTAIQLKNNSRNAKKWNLLSAGATSQFPEGSFAVQNESDSNAPFVIAPNGNVGIGTSSPQGQLEIYGTGDIIFRSEGDRTGGLRFENSRNDEFGKIYGSLEGLRLRANSARTEDLFINRYTGNIGMGTISTPTARLYVTAQTEGINASAYRAIIATSNNGYGITSNGGPAGIGITTSGRIGIQSLGTTYDFYAQGSGNNYGPFTGSHEVKLDMGASFEKGMVVSVTGQVERHVDTQGQVSISSTLPLVKLADTERDAAVFGVFVSESPLPEGHWYTPKSGERFGVVNALGEGRVWLTNVGGEVRLGDYVTTSKIPGYAQKQADDVLHSYTLGKVIEKIDWQEVKEKIEISGKHYKRHLAAIVYVSG